MSNRPKILVQGNDFKARQWMRAFEPGAVVHFVSLQELWKQAMRRGEKVVVFRYLNSNKTKTSDVLHIILLYFLGLTKFWHQSNFVWILHNIDKETVDNWPFLTNLKRSALHLFSRRIFVMDEYFRTVYFPENPKYRALSFGEKDGGTVSSDNLDRIRSFAHNHDQLVLCLGAKGEKYRHFSALGHLNEQAKDRNIRLGFILPPDQYIEGVSFLEIDEPNIDERALAPYVDFVYRINDDVSMPYTLYAACDAKIPIVTSSDFFTYKIVDHYGIGFSEKGWFMATDSDKKKVHENMGAFLARKSWNSLADALCGDFPDLRVLRKSESR